MTGILAIDPAWTSGQPSGVALLEGSAGSWQCVAVAPSYEQFIAIGVGIPVDWTASPKGGIPDVDTLLDSATTLLDGSPVDLVAIDMPIATIDITGRRNADSAISREFGGRGCSTHSPSSVRPGAIGKQLTEAFARRGYPVATSGTAVGTMPALIEVYPHTALLALMSANYRVPYKVSRAGKYWPDIPPSERRSRLVSTWDAILEALGKEIGGIDLSLPQPAELALAGPSKLKRYEDAIDAVVCGWVGATYATGNCLRLGDDVAAIWTPPFGS